MRLVSAIGLTTVAVACSSTSREPSPSATPSALPTGVVRIESAGGPVELRVQIAETTEARRRGLMGVRHLDADAGMVFLFPEPVDPGFWMKDTIIPLAIAFWDSDGRIAAIREMAPCRRDPCPLYSPGVPVVGAVEANRGYFADHGAGPGDRIELIRDSDRTPSEDDY
jgi:uncharacterized membrane protein (UPF0127 family)